MFAEFDATLAISRSVFSQVPVPQHSRWQQVWSKYMKDRAAMPCTPFLQELFPLHRRVCTAVTFVQEP